MSGINHYKLTNTMTEIILLKKVLLVLLIICISGCKQKISMVTPDLNLASGTVERFPDFKSDYVTARNIDIWLPDDFNRYEIYSVIYMHDGQMLFDSITTWNNQEWCVDETIGRLINERRIHKCIIVGIWNSGQGRHSDYFPGKPYSNIPDEYLDSLMRKSEQNNQPVIFADGVNSDNYLKFIVKELKPFIDNRYPTMPDRENTFIAGSSMGGLISMYAICEYPEVFGGAACLSTHWIGTFEADNNPVPSLFIEYLGTNLPDPATHKLYFDFGTETLDSLYEPYQLQADSIIFSGGYDESNYLSLKYENRDHSESSWAERLHIPLVFLIGIEE